MPLQLPTGGIDAERHDARSTIEMNLDARAGVTLPARRRTIDFADADTYNNATSLTVYDAKGQDVALTYYFQKAGTDTVERLRHRQRQHRGRHARPRRSRSTTHRPSRPTAARRPRRPAPVTLDVPASPTRRARRPCRSPASRST